MKEDRPLLICISRTRNYGWVTRAFLEGNSRWADYIIVTDQMSTDATRPLCAEYNEKCKKGRWTCKGVIIVDDPDLSFKENGGFKMAFAKGREIAAGRDTIFFAMDIDEVMPANWQTTNEGKMILSSKPGDMFSIAWANIKTDNKTYVDDRLDNPGKYTVFHDNGMDWQKCPIELHAPHLPYSSWDIAPYAVKDFPILHFGYYHTKWSYYKHIYLQFVDIHQRRSDSPIRVYRAYHPSKKKSHAVNKLSIVDAAWLFDDFDLFSLIDLKSDPIFISYMRELIDQDGIQIYGCLDVWDDDLKNKLGIEVDPRPLGWRMIHAYLRATQNYKETKLIRGVDKVLRMQFKTSY